MPDAHARLGPSAAHRWIECPASVKMSEQMDEKPQTSSYADEGTNAHTLAELEAGYALGQLSKGQYLQRHASWLKTVTPEQAKEMHEHVKGYVEFVLARKAANLGSTVLLEQRVHPGVPESWGTSDTVIVGLDAVEIIDFKYGQGIRVVADSNPQLMLYGVGALEEFGDVIGDTQTVRMSIYQPRIDHVSSWEMPAADLRAWRDTVIPIAEEALGDDAHFGPSAEACRFCPAAGLCRPRMQKVTAEDFGADVNLLDNGELADAFKRLPEIRDWCSKIEEAALEATYTRGEYLPGLKVVMSGGKRSVPDAAAAIQLLIDKGFKAEQVARFQLQTLGELEKLVGKKELPELLGGMLVKSPGRPSIVGEDDPRPTASPAAGAAADFAD